MSRLEALQHFYHCLDRLEACVGGKRSLKSCSGRMTWPGRGVYFFFETGEVRQNSGGGPRVVRVGTHALKAGSKSTLWGRLSQHKGKAKTPGGNHRGSIFRLLVGTALIKTQDLDCSSWGQGNTANRATREAEQALEAQVSEVIGNMPFLWLAVEDETGPDSQRGIIERNSIALLSNAAKTPIDAVSPTWLGHECNRRKVRSSALWNQNHVDENYDPAFLDIFNRLIDQMEKMR